jgi:putative transposase
VIGADRSSVRYRCQRPDDEAIRVRLREIAAVRRRFSYRHLHILLQREGLTLNHKKAASHLRRGRLQVRRRGGRKRALGTRAPPALPQGPNQRWSMDFLHDQLSDGRRFRILAIVDDFTRECLALVADTSLSGLRVGRELDALIAERGKPAACVSDNGTELNQHRDPALVAAERRRVALHRVGQTAAERLYRELQWPCARRVAERNAVQLARPRPNGPGRMAARLHTVRPHSSLGNLPPSHYAQLNASAWQRDRSLRAIGATRPAPLPHRAKQAQMANRLYSSLDEKRGSVHQEQQYFSDV